MESEIGPKLKSLKNFLTNPDSKESQNYISSLLSGKFARPEDAFIDEFLSSDFWKEMGYQGSERIPQGHAGVRGYVEHSLDIDGKKIAVECKQPYDVTKDGEAIPNELDGSDITELKNQIEPYLLSHDFIIYTNGFFWYFYSRESYSIWARNKDKKENKLKPYFDYLTAEQIFDESSPKYITNILTRKNILESLSSLGDKSVRNAITDEFFIDLKNWVSFIDNALKDTPSDAKARTTSLINKLIFVRTMEGVGIIPNGFLATLWDNKKGIRNSTVDFIDHIDDELTEIYDTELFTSKYVVDEDGDPILHDGLPEFSKERQKNYAYKNIAEDFFSAILRPTSSLNLNDVGKSRIILKGKEYFIRSLYWWRFESIPEDILGKAYETYLARERKKLGIYYTPHHITEYLTSKTVSTIFDEKYVELQSELEKEKWNI